MIHAKDIKPCACCNGSLGIMPIHITVQRLGIDKHAVNEYMGMTQFFQGHTGLADVMAPDTELLKEIPDLPPTSILICMDCFVVKLGELAHRIEIQSKTDEPKEDG